jgi:hypothetical protein
MINYFLIKKNCFSSQYFHKIALKRKTMYLTGSFYMKSPNISDSYKINNFLRSILYPGLIKSDCFQPGECQDSLLITGEPRNDEFACLEFCQSNPNCQWLTFLPDGNYCKLLSNCQTLDSEKCPECLTSRRDCSPDDPVCFVKGECQGMVNNITAAGTASECLQLCNSIFGCHWFTFNPEVSKCILLKSCSTIDPSCKECTSGERRCLETSTTKTTPEESSSSVPVPTGEQLLSNLVY